MSLLFGIVFSILSCGSDQNARDSQTPGDKGIQFPTWDALLPSLIMPDPNTDIFRSAKSAFGGFGGGQWKFVDLNPDQRSVHSIALCRHFYNRHNPKDGIFQAVFDLTLLANRLSEIGDNKNALMVSDAAARLSLENKCYNTAISGLAQAGGSAYMIGDMHTARNHYRSIAAIWSKAKDRNNWQMERFHLYGNPSNHIPVHDQICHFGEQIMCLSQRFANRTESTEYAQYLIAMLRVQPGKIGLISGFVRELARFDQELCREALADCLKNANAPPFDTPHAKATYEKFVRALPLSVSAIIDDDQKSLESLKRWSDGYKSWHVEEMVKLGGGQYINEVQSKINRCAKLINRYAPGNILRVDDWFLSVIHERYCSSDHLLSALERHGDAWEQGVTTGLYLGLILRQEDALAKAIADHGPAGATRSSGPIFSVGYPAFMDYLSKRNLSGDGNLLLSMASLYFGRQLNEIRGGKNKRLMALYNPDAYAAIIRRNIPEDEVVVCSMPMKTATLTIAFNSQKLIVSRSLTSRVEVERIADLVYRDLSSSSSGKDYVVNVTQLSSSLLSDVHSSFQNVRKVWVVAANEVSKIPWEVIPWNDNTPLGSQCDVGYLPSPDWLVSSSLSADPLAANIGTGTVVVANPSYASSLQELSGLEELPETMIEVQAMKEVFGDAGCKSLTGQHATKEAVLQLNLSGTKVVHFACHGVLAGEMPGIDQPALWLAGTTTQDAALTMTDIMGMSRQAQITVLSACNTGSGNRLSGEGALSLNRAFLATGSTFVVSSLWAVNSAITVDLMSEFYKAMDTRKDVGEAMRMARRSVADRANGLSCALTRGMKATSHTTDDVPPSLTAARLVAPFVVMGAPPRVQMPAYTPPKCDVIAW